MISYGYLFHDLLLGAAKSARIVNVTNSANSTEDLNDRTFNFRQPGLNVDFMSYTSLALVNNNNSALLDPAILANVSNAVFSMFFMNFAQTPVPSADGLYMKGSWVIQAHDEVLPSGLGPTLDSSSTIYLQDVASSSDTSPTITATISTRVTKLQFNRVPVILSLSIVGFLAATTLFIPFYHKHHLKFLPRNVDTLGSVLGFTYSSDRLLHSAAHTYASSPSTTKEEQVAMGWFGSGGRRRWGIEIVDEREKQAAELPDIEDVDPAHLEPLARGSGSRSLQRGDLGERGVPERVRQESIDDFHRAHDMMGRRTPPISVASPPLGSIYAIRYE